MSIDQERSDIHAALNYLASQVGNLQETVESRPAPLLSEEEHRWVRLAIKKEAQSIEFRSAVISKTLVGLIWMAVAAAVGFAWTLIQTWASSHGYKP